LPLPQEWSESLQKNSGTIQEKLLVLLLEDLKGRKVDLASLHLADIDRITGLLRLPPRDGHTEVARLGLDTMKAFHEYTLKRGDTNPALFVNNEGQMIGAEQLVAIASRVAERSGLEFDRESFQFRSIRSENPRLVTKTASRDLFYLYGIISHALRREIVELLGDQGPLGFSQIKQRLNVKVGTLYYHFDMLDGLITRDAQRRYLLTTAGRDAYEKLRSAEYVQSSNILAQHVQTSQTSVERSFRLLVPAKAIMALQSRTPLAIAGAVLLLVLGSLSVFQAHLITVLLFLDPSDENPLLLGIGFLANWIVIFGVADLLATYLFGRKGEHLTLLIGTTYALIPVLVFVAWWDLAITFSIQAFGLTIFALSRVILILLQAWSLAILARIVSGLKGLRLDKAAVISLVIAYLSITVAYLRGV